MWAFSFLLHSSCLLCAATLSHNGRVLSLWSCKSKYTFTSINFIIEFYHINIKASNARRDNHMPSNPTKWEENFHQIGINGVSVGSWLIFEEHEDIFNAVTFIKVKIRHRARKAWIHYEHTSKMHVEMQLSFDSLKRWTPKRIDVGDLPLMWMDVITKSTR